MTVGRGSTGGVEETETGGVEETEEFQFKPMVNATEEFQSVSYTHLTLPTKA